MTINEKVLFLAESVCTIDSCLAWSPNDSYGCGCYCDLLEETICPDKVAPPIPSNCPRLAENFSMDVLRKYRDL